MTSLTNNKKPSIAVPILFVPGIMGSRLTNKDSKIVWDPPPTGVSSKGVAALVKGLSNNADDRKQELIGEPGKSFDSKYLRVAGLKDSPSHGVTVGTGRNKRNPEEEHWKKVVTAPPGPEKITINPSQLSLAVALCSTEQPHKTRGWGTVHWESYGPFLQWLEQMCTDITLKGVNCHVYLPIYACGYNWTASNADSAEGLAGWIDDAKKEMGELDIEMDKVLIISHSMGGFVSRYCAVGKTARENDIHAICHIAMPDNGSPATYKRMKAGFEDWAIKKILGTNGEEVTAVMGHAPGALELLPNIHYRQQNGTQGGWLTLEDKDEAIPLFQGNPYETVYKERDKWWRLINPDWLEPNDTVDDAEKEDLFDRKYIMGTLQQARSFHEELKEKKHSNTWLIYSTSPSTAWEKIQWRLFHNKKTGRGRGIKTYEYNATTTQLEALRKINIQTEEGDGKISLSTPQDSSTTALYSVRIQPGTAAGDGTVHRGAGDHAINVVHYVPLNISDDHQEMMNNKQVKDHVEHFVKTMLRNFAQCGFHDKCGM